MSDAEKPKKMDDSELNSLISGLATDAAEFVDGTLSPLRAEATKYYLADKLGNEEVGRSQYVHSTVRDNVLAVLPQALRVIFGAEHPVEFVPTRKETVPQAEQATDYVRHVFSQDNNGFMVTHAVWKDALVRKLGVYKWAVDDTSAVTTYKLDNIAHSQLEALVAEDSVELLRATETKPAVDAVEVDGQVVQPATDAEYSVELKHAEVDGRIRIWALPPEEFLFSRDGRDLETATLVGHRTHKTTGELLAMGVKQADIDEHGGEETTLPENEETVARQDVVGGESTAQSVPAGTANDRHLYGELFVFVDFDGDGLAELRRICTIGPTYHVISNDPAPERPFAIYCPDPEPHTMLGQSWADRLMAMQKMQSSIVRANADSLALSIFPRTAYVEGMVNPIDLDNTEIGASIRVKDINALREIAHTYVGKESFPLLEFLDNAVEQRTGQDRGAMGLDADALQSTEKAAAGAAIAASQGQVELLVRLFAEMTLKPLFRGILRTLVRLRPKARMTRLRGKWVEIDPRVWDANMDVTVNVALGTSLIEKKIAALLGMAAKQELVLTTLGAVNPLVTPRMYGNTLRKLTELNGFMDVDNYFGDVPADYQPPAPQGPPPDPMVQVKMQELQQKDQHAQQQSALDQLKMQQDAQRHADEMAQKEADRQQALELAQEEIRLKLELGSLEIESKYKTTIAVEQLRARVETAKEIAKQNREIGAQSLEHERSMVELHAGVATDVAHLHAEHRALDIAQQEADKPEPSGDSD